MERNSCIKLALGSYIALTVGIAAYLIRIYYLSFTVLCSLYWAFFGTCLIFLLLSTFWKFRALFPKLTTYFQIWGTLGTFYGLMKMCAAIALAVNAGDTDAIKGVLAGFSTALVTSLIGMIFALWNDILPDDDDDDLALDAAAVEPSKLLGQAAINAAVESGEASVKQTEHSEQGDK